MATLTEMNRKRALALAKVALEAVADDNPDVLEWSQARAVIAAELAEERANGGNGSDRPPGAWDEVKTISGRQYLYWRWRQGGKTRSKYIGPVKELRPN